LPHPIGIHVEPENLTYIQACLLYSLRSKGVGVYFWQSLQ
jgi:hypothetical protein